MGFKTCFRRPFCFTGNNFKNVIDYVKISRIIQLIRKHKASLNNLKG